MAFAASDYQNSEDPLTLEEHNLFYRLQTIFTHKEMMTWEKTLKITHKDIWYESVGIFLSRDEHYCLAVKAGDNNDSHNHNDTGSFTIYKDGSPLLIDVGVETYSKKTFSPERYEIWTMQSCYHNLPTFFDGDMPILQKDGEEYRAKEVSYQFTPAENRISMDLKSAYPDERIRSYLRSAVHKKEKEIVIEDHYEGSLKSPVLSLMFYEEPMVTGDVISIGNLAKLSVTGAISIKKERIPITDLRLKTAWKHDIYRLLITMDHQDIKLIIQ